MTINNPPQPPPSNPTGPTDLPADENAAWGCLWWWWVVIIIVILCFWWAGWGWGPYGGYWFRRRPVVPNPVPTRTTPPTTSTERTPRPAPQWEHDSFAQLRTASITTP